MSKLNIFIIGVGGQGSLSASRFIGEAAMASHKNVLVGDVHGMAQRGGIVESTVRIGDVYGPIIADGSADMLLGFEPAETLRFLHKVKPNALVIMNTHPIVPANVSLNGNGYPPITDILKRIQQVTQKIIAFDATQLAADAGNIKALNAVMLGALAATESLPIKTDVIETILLNNIPQKFRQVNMQAFSTGVWHAKHSPTLSTAA